MTGDAVRFGAPNTTQVPDEFWRLLPDMGDAELRVTLYLVRQTFGFRREWTPREFATNAAIMRNTGLSEQGVRNGIAAGMKAARIDRQIGPDGKGWVYRLIVRTANDPELAPIPEPSVVVIPEPTPNDVDPQRGGPPTTLTPNDVDPLNTKTLKPSFTNVQDGCAAPAAPARRARAKAPKATKPESDEPRPPSPHAVMFGTIADVCGYDVTFLSEHDRANIGKLSRDCIAADLTPEDIAAAWREESERIAAFAEGRPVSPPTIARLRTLIGAYRKRRAAAPIGTRRAVSVGF